jgi:hypothetical protein
MLTEEGKPSLTDTSTDPAKDIPPSGDTAGDTGKDISVSANPETQWNRSELAKLVGLKDDYDQNSSGEHSSVGLGYSETGDLTDESQEHGADVTQGNVLGAEELFDDPHLAATPKTVAKSPFAKLGFVAGGLGVAFLFAGLVLNGVMSSKGDLKAKTSTPTPTPTVDAQKQQEDTEGRLKTELALNSQTDELKQLDEAKKNQKKQEVSPTDPKRQKTADGKATSTAAGNQDAKTSTASTPSRTPRSARVSSPPPPPPPRARASSPPVSPAPVPSVAQSRPPLPPPPPSSFSQVAAAAPVAPPPPPKPVSDSSRSTQKATPTAVATPRSDSEVDPIAQWQTLASLGSYSDNSSSVSSPQGDDQVPVASPVANTPMYAMQRSQQLSANTMQRPQQFSSANTIPVSQSQPQPQSQPLPQAPPAVASEVSAEQRLLDGTPYRIAPTGAMTAALSVTPLVLPTVESRGQSSRTSGADTPDRVVVTLTAPLTDTSDQVVMPAGTSLVFEVRAVDTNGVINAVAVSQLDNTGMEQPLPSESLVLTGQEGSPLIAKGYFDDGGTIASMDFSTAALGALGKVGEILNRPKEQTSSSTSGGTVSQTTTSTTGEPNLLGALLEGGASPVLDQILKRNDRAIQDLQKRKNLWFLEAGTPVQIMVTRSFEL